MDSVSFDEPDFAPSHKPERKTGALTRMVISSGLSKDEEGAQTVLLVVFFACLIAALAVALAGGVVGPSAAPTPMIIE